MVNLNKNYNLVQLHDGEILVNSALGKGSDFYFTLSIAG